MNTPVPHPCDLRPRSDPPTLQLLQSTIETLAQQRHLPSNHPAVRMHLVASLLQQAEPASSTPSATPSTPQEAL